MNLASKRIDLHDFVAPENSGDAPLGEDAKSAMKLIDGLKAHDASIHLTAETIIIGTHTLESVGLEATLTSGDLRLLLHGADAFVERGSKDTPNMMSLQRVLAGPFFFPGMPWTLA